MRIQEARNIWIRRIRIQIRIRNTAYIKDKQYEKYLNVACYVVVYFQGLGKHRKSYF